MFVYSSNHTATKKKSQPKVKKAPKAKAMPKASAFVGPSKVEEPRLKKVSPPSFAKSLPKNGEQSVADAKPKTAVNHFKLIMVVVALGALGFMYLAHVKATTSLFEERNTKRLEYERAQHRVEELERRYERAISPSKIYENANKAGFIHSGANDEVINVSKKGG